MRMFAMTDECGKEKRTKVEAATERKAIYAANGIHGPTGSKNLIMESTLPASYENDRRHWASGRVNSWN